MTLKYNLTIRVGCEKYELILDTEHKKSFVGTMLSHYREYGIERGALDEWCERHGIEYKRSFGYRKDKGIFWNIWNAASAFAMRYCWDSTSA